jgi:hypothetical protein
MRLRIAIASCALLLLPLIIVAGENPKDDGIAHGTINIALGNKNGLVVLTDSMVTATDATRRYQLPNAGQKLFKLDNRTVCSVAGFASAPAVSPGVTASDLNTNTSAIIHEYVKQSTPQARQSIAEKMGALTSLFRLHLATIANVRDATGNPPPLENYKFELIVAGYDIDDKPKIGRITLRVESDKGSLVSRVENASLTNVEEKLIWQLNGISDVAMQILQHPESRPEDVVLNQYASSLIANGGGALTIEQMVELAKRLAHYTSQVYREVGGPNQIAILQKQDSITIEQPPFPELPRPLVNFSLMVNSGFNGSRLGVAPGVHLVAIRCSWANVQRELDGNYYIGNDFVNSVLTYDGGDVDLGDTNRVINSVLAIGPHAILEYEAVRRLTATFSWSLVGYASPTWWQAATH